MYRINLCNFLTSYSSDYVRQNGTLSKFISFERWVILTDIEKHIKGKIERIGTQLKDWDIKINFGIKTGFNDAFIITGEKRKEIIEKDPKSEEIIRPILRGRDIKRYGYDFANLWLINTHNGIKEKSIKPIDINDYPTVKKHLDDFYPQLEKRADKGDTPYNLRNCAYTEELFKQKIIWGEISDRTKFCIDKRGEYVTEATTFLLTGESLLYLLGFLNSRLSEYMFSQIGTTTGVGTVRWKKYTIEQLRVPKISNEEQEKYIQIVNQIIEKNSKNECFTHLLIEIDNLIYNEFGFTIDEIEIIKNPY